MSLSISPSPCRYLFMPLEPLSKTIFLHIASRPKYFDAIWCHTVKCIKIVPGLKLLQMTVNASKLHISRQIISAYHNHDNPYAWVLEYIISIFPCLAVIIQQWFCFRLGLRLSEKITSPTKTRNLWPRTEWWRGHGYGRWRLKAHALATHRPLLCNQT